jgi:hypothetical protein
MKDLLEGVLDRCSGGPRVARRTWAPLPPEDDDPPISEEGHGHRVEEAGL